MYNNLEKLVLDHGAKAKWVTPRLTRLRAGAAEFGPNFGRDDGDTNSAKDNS